MHSLWAFHTLQSPAPKPQPPIAVCVKAEVPAARPAPPPALRPRLLASSNQSILKEISPGISLAPTVTGSSFLKVLLGWPGWFTLGLPCLTAVVGRAKSAVIPAVRLQENEKPRPCPPLKWVWGSPSRSSGYDSALHCPWVSVQSLLITLWLPW